MRAASILLALWLAAIGCGRDGLPPVGAPGPRNIVLVSIDTLRADHLSPYGYPRDTSPTLARLAQGGVVFDQAFSVISHTLPAHVSLMTGIHPSGHGILANGWRYEGTFPTLPERLREAGYDTAGFTSGFPLVEESGIARGFGEYHDTRDWLDRARAKVPGTEVTAAARRWVARDAREPFFLFVHYYDAHPPYLRSDGAEFPFEVDDTLRSVMRERGVTGLPIEASSHAPLTLDGRELSLAEAINTYDNEIHHVDAMLGELLDVLRARGVLEHTVVIVTSDHGEGLGEHGYYQHGLHLYEEQIHVPLIVRGFDTDWPARRVCTPVSLLDVSATLLDAVGLPGNAPQHGQSLLALLRGAEAMSERWVVAQRRSFSPELALQRGRFAAQEALFALRGPGPTKLLWSASGRTELYDLAADPHESRDLAGQRVAERERLSSLLGDLRGRYARDAQTPDAHVDAETQTLLESLGYLP